MEENKRERWKKAVLPERDTKMGFYLNSRAPYVLYEGETKSRYFIDKTLMLEKIFGFIEEEVDGLYEVSCGYGESEWEIIGQILVHMMRSKG